MSSASDITLSGDPGKDLYTAFIKELLRRVTTLDVAAELSAAELELIRKVASDNSINLASIRKGDFGETCKRVAEDFPFPEGPQVGSSVQ